jgi:hypothetical protein
MQILNQNLEFEQLSSDFRNAFSGLKADKVLLRLRTSLFRFSGGTHISPRWSETTQLPYLLLSAKQRGQRLDQYIRATNALLRSWDPGMYNLIIAKLNIDVYAFRGTSSFQNEAFKYMNPQDIDNYKKKFTKPVFYQGGNSQVFINNIKDQDINIIVPGGAINIYDEVDDIINFLIDNYYSIF